MAITPKINTARRNINGLLPEVAIMGMYKISEKPIIKRDASGVMSLDAIKTMNFTITADHRLIDGAVAANFLKAFMQRIENPGVLMLDMI